MAKEVKYPVGEQDFKMLREADCIYVDKMEERLYARPYRNEQRRIFKIGVSF